MLTIADPERLRYSRDYVQQVAESLGISLAAVYLAKGRVMGRLKARIEALQNDLEETRFEEK